MGSEATFIDFGRADFEALEVKGGWRLNFEIVASKKFLRQTILFLTLKL